MSAEEIMAAVTEIEKWKSLAGELVEAIGRYLHDGLRAEILRDAVDKARKAGL